VRMGIKIKSNRLKEKPVSTFGVKKPFKAKAHNRKGSKKVSKVSIKEANFNDVDLFDKSIVIRFDSVEYKQRQDYVKAIGLCQCCNVSVALDTPHHAAYGSGKKDDRYLVCICISCHLEIHSGSYSNLLRSREELKEIGWDNHLKIMESVL